MNIHDSGYKRLFRNKTIFRQLIETFVEEAWVQELDFDHATRLDKSFISDHYKETESDIIYRVPLQRADGREVDVYVYVLIEFQSGIQRFMLIRVLHYLTSLYLDHLATHGTKERLPAVLPIVLYNGDRSWTAPTTMIDLVEEYPPLGDYQIRFQYLKIAENEFTLNRLMGFRNIVSALFIAEAYYDPSTLEEILLRLYDEEPDREAVYLFLNWFKQLANYGKIDETAFGSLETAIQGKEEVRSMLVTAQKRHAEKLREQLRDEVRHEVRDEVRHEVRDEVRHEQALQIAKSMLAQNFAPAQIADLVGLSLDQVIQLRDGEDSASS